jgi:hypothetical protein
MATILRRANHLAGRRARVTSGEHEEAIARPGVGHPQQRAAQPLAQRPSAFLRPVYEQSTVAPDRPARLSRRGA